MPRLPVRRLIQEVVFDERLDFQPIDGHAPYTYQRTVAAGGETFYDTVGLGSSQKYPCFAASIAWGLFPIWEGVLGTDEIRAATGLPYLCGRRRMEEQVYEHDGTEAGARLALGRIADDLTSTGEPWFRERTAAALAHPLVILGLQWVRSHPEARTAKQGYRYNEEVRDELSRVLRRRAYELGLEPRIKKGIAMLAYHLLEFAADVDRG
jgi:hypothetical protein